MVRVLLSIVIGAKTGIINENKISKKLRSQKREIVILINL